MGVDINFALSLTSSEQLSWYIAIGEQKGGIWDEDEMTWHRPPQPDPVFAIPAEMKE